MPTVRMPMALAVAATTGAAPLPVPPPMPACSSSSVPCTGQVHAGAAMPACNSIWVHMEPIRTLATLVLRRGHQFAMSSQQGCQRCLCHVPALWPGLQLPNRIMGACPCRAAACRPAHPIRSSHVADRHHRAGQSPCNSTHRDEHHVSPCQGLLNHSLALIGRTLHGSQ